MNQLIHLLKTLKLIQFYENKNNYQLTQKDLGCSLICLAHSGKLNIFG